MSKQQYNADLAMGLLLSSSQLRSFVDTNGLRPLLMNINIKVSKLNILKFTKLYFF